jgi:iron complex transport system substrate-binding protein
MISLNRFAPRVFTCAVLGLSLGMAAGKVAAQPVQATDARGVVVRLEQPARRIVTLTPHLTELTYAAGAGASLAGVARFSNYPEQARHLPVVGDAVQFDVERLLMLRPDLVLAWQSGTPSAAVARLERAGLRVFVSEANSLEDIGRGIGAIAALAGTQPAGARARAAFDAGLRALRDRRYSGAPVRVFYEIWPKPLMTVSNAHIISEVIALCGGVNIFGDLQPLTPEVSREALLAARPEVALGGGSAESASGFAARWAALPPPLGSVPAYHIAPDLIQRPTPRLLEGAYLVCAYLDAVRPARR